MVNNYKLPSNIFDQRQYIYKQAIKKPAQMHFHSKRSHTITKMDNNINMDSSKAGSMNDNINMDSSKAGSMNDNINMDSSKAGSMNACSIFFAICLFFQEQIYTNMIL
jgi:hypothetical protein